MTTALHDVIDERARQDAKWGEQNHDSFTYLTVFMEEVGEASQAVLHMRFGGNQGSEYRKEVVQVAAVALAMLECVDRNTWFWGTKKGPGMDRKGPDRDRIGTGLAPEGSKTGPT